MCYRLSTRYTVRHLPVFMSLSRPLSSRHHLLSSSPFSLRLQSSTTPHHTSSNPFLHAPHPLPHPHTRHVPKLKQTTPLSVPFVLSPFARFPSSRPQAHTHTHGAFFIGLVCPLLLVLVQTHKTRMQAMKPSHFLCCLFRCRFSERAREPSTASSFHPVLYFTHSHTHALHHAAVTAGSSMTIREREREKERSSQPSCCSFLSSSSSPPPLMLPRTSSTCSFPITSRFFPAS